MKIELTKLEESNNPLRPGNIPIGEVLKGEFYAYPIVGEAYDIGTWHTSTVQEILSTNTFRTHNSIYKFKLIKE